LQAVERGDPEGAISLMLGEYQKAYGVYNTLVAVDEDASVVAAGDPALLGVTVTNADWYRKVMDSGRPYMAPLRYDSDLGGYGVSLAVPIFKKYSDGYIIGVLKASLDWRELLQQVTAIEVVPEGQVPDGYAVLIDSEGYILAAPDFILFSKESTLPEAGMARVYDSRWWVAENPMLLDRVLTRPGHRYIRRGNDELMLVNMPASEFRYIGKTGWSLVLVRNARSALKDIEYIRERAFLIGIITVLLIGLVAYIMSRQIGSPITRLSRWAEQLSHGSLDSNISLRSNDELAQLASALDNMRRNLKKYLDELFESKERYQSIISSIDCVVWEAHINPLKVTLLSGQVDHVLGRSPDQVLSHLDSWQSLVHSDHQALLIEACTTAIERGTDTYVEFKFLHGNGNWMWVKALISVAIEDLGVVGLRGVVVDINDIVIAAEEMAEARDIALKTAEDKSRFMAIVSHEIRTPINGMLGMLDMLSGQTGVDEQQQTLSMAKRSGRNLLALVDEVMDFTRLENGEIEFNYQEFDIHELFNTAVSLVSVDAYSRGLDIGVAMEASLPQKVIADGTKLNQVLTSLLSNAVKFTSHGSILLWTEMLSPSRLYVEVKDTGVGIETELQQALFEPFVQADVSDTRKYGGSGLGLALCEGLLSAMGGKIGVKSIKGVGSSFYFELPVTVPDFQPAFSNEVRSELQRQHSEAAVLLIGDLPATQMVIKLACQQWGVGFHWEQKERRILRNLEAVLHQENYRWIFIAQDISDAFWEKLHPYLNSPEAAKIVQLRVPTERYGQRPLPHLYVPFSGEELAACMLGRPGKLPYSEAEMYHPHPDLPLVLVVDDNEVNRRVACGYLRKLGFSCDIAEDGRQAVEAVKHEQYGIVFMDCQMPVLDGYQATRAIRAELQGRPLPIVAVTANAMEGDREKCLSAGMDDYLTKPLRKERLQQVIARWYPVVSAPNHGIKPSA